MTEATDPVEAAFAWWAKITSPGGDRGALARLRRGNVSAASLEPAVMDLAKAIGADTASRLPKAAMLAIALACVREHEKLAFGRKIGRSRFAEEDSAKLSHLRFLSLMQAKTDERFLTNLRRAIAIAGEEANVFDVARLMLFHDRQRVRDVFTLQYYAVREDRINSQAA